MRVASDEEMVSIRILTSKGFVVTGHGYQYRVVDGCLKIDRVDGAESLVDRINMELAHGKRLNL
jgi:hypothetical protein